MAQTGLYRGFSSFEFQRKKTFALSDLELVKLDLLNHIFTRKGERLMMPTFGTNIPDMVFEPLDNTTIESITDDLRDVFNYDPRVQLLNLNIDAEYDNNLLTIAAEVLYLELAVVDNFNFNLQFEAG